MKSYKFFYTHLRYIQKMCGTTPARFIGDVRPTLRPGALVYN